ncbi:MAG: isocitrate lyase [Chloroflexi bacterium]|nr:isocitrate lyase [Chloroflexota bacterium]MDL1883559.1 isocitrate lyase [Anaerolineae bacterium CFX8]GIL12625.1 MAG: isocitrate lyase [Chloroflexota bacterium]
MQRQRNAEQITMEWNTRPRWKGITREYTADEVVRLRGSVHIEYSLAQMGAEQLWDLLNREPYVAALGALTGTQAVQMVAAGLKAVYVSGWQVAGDMNTSLQTYPDQSLYPVDSGPTLVRRINNALLRADQIQHLEGKKGPFWLVPLIADGEAGFGGILNTFELTKAFIEAGAAAIHYEDQLSSAKKCGHLGGKVLAPTSEFIRKLVAARLAADVCDVPTLIIARTDAESATLLANTIDPRDEEFITGERSPEGFFYVRGGVESAIARGLAYAPYADMLWCETSHPDLDEAKKFAEGIRREFPDKLLFYNCSPSFNWSRNLDAATIAKFQRELGAMGYKFQFITLAGFHSLNYAMFDLARKYHDQGMTAYAELQDAEFEAEREYGYRAVKHQTFVGTGYFDALQDAITGGTSATVALKHSTEAEQFANGEKVNAAH